MKYIRGNKDEKIRELMNKLSPGLNTWQFSENNFYDLIDNRIMLEDL